MLRWRGQDSCTEVPTDDQGDTIALFDRKQKRTKRSILGAKAFSGHGMQPLGSFLWLMQAWQPFSAFKFSSFIPVKKKQSG